MFNLPNYYAPYGYNYGYQRFSIGYTLSALLFDRNYWIEDPYYYRLPQAYGSYRWVRYYDDALLVDLRTGYVVDVVYDIFY
ncbi:MAG: RcnB family protein [Sphingomonas sp.]